MSLGTSFVDSLVLELLGGSRGNWLLLAVSRQLCFLTSNINSLLISFWD